MKRLLSLCFNNVLIKRVKQIKYLILLIYRFKSLFGEIILILLSNLFLNSVDVVIKSTF